jgi:hypothetical protein
MLISVFLNVNHLYMYLMSFAIITTLVIMKQTALDHFTNDLLSVEERKVFVYLFQRSNTASTLN